jgi:hypothetical protein
MTKEKANSTAKNKVRGKAKRKAERETKVSEGTI